MLLLIFRSICIVLLSAFTVVFFAYFAVCVPPIFIPDGSFILFFFKSAVKHIIPFFKNLLGKSSVFA